MIDVRTSAPGKVFIAGEYAVLQGAPAICMAVDRRVRVMVTAADTEHHHVSAPEHASSSSRFVAGQDGLQWLPGDAPVPLLEAVWQELTIQPRQPLAIVLDSRDFVDQASGRKLGIGASAALTVALVAALDRTVGGGCNVLELAARAHRRLQGGTGSGTDIACSLHGGVIEYHMDTARHTNLQWPHGLCFALLWSGVRSDTSQQLAKLARISPGATDACLIEAASAVSHAWRSGEASNIAASMRAYAAALQRYDAERRLGIYGAGHAELASAAETAGVVYKPCGAGGGDLGMVIGAHADVVESFVDTARRQGFSQLPLFIEAGGLCYEGDGQ